MDCELMAGIPQLIQAAGSDDASIQLGPIFIRLLDMVEAIHKTYNLVVDVKTSNIMLAPEQEQDNDTLDISAFAVRLRLIDFGLMTHYHSPMSGKHYANTSTGSNQGTPLYWSRHVHAGNTPSRRDDLEAMGLVMAELIIRLQAMVEGTTATYEKDEELATYLPWANAGSDDGIAAVKKDMLPDSKSPFYERMGSQATARAMHKFFHGTHSLEFTKEPKYDAFRSLLRDMHVANPNVTAAQPTRRRGKRQKDTGQVDNEITTERTTKRRKTNR